MNLLLQDIYSFGEVTLITEGKSRGPLKFKGIFSEADRPNGNKRIYKRDVLVREVEKLQPRIAERRLLGELDHPTDEIVHLSNVSHVITSLRMEGNKVVGEGEVLDTPAGKVLSSLLKSGIKLGISSRGTGSVELDESGECYRVGDNYKMITFDMVSEPSSQEAFPSLAEHKQLVEAKETLAEEFEQHKNEKIFITALKRRLNKL